MNALQQGLKGGIGATLLSLLGAVAAVSSPGETALPRAARTAASSGTPVSLASQYTAHPTAEYPLYVVMGDLDGDPYTDMAVANHNSNTLTIHRGCADGSFAVTGECPVGTQPRSLSLGDFNEDGRLDIVSANYGSNNLSVLLNAGAGAFSPAANYSIAPQALPLSAVVCDVNGNGHDDFVALTCGGSLIIFSGAGDGSFVRLNNAFASGGVGRFFAPGYVDDDASVDLIVPHEGQDAVSFLRGNGDGTFQPALQFPAGVEPWMATLHDINQDGNPDVITADYGGGTVSVLLGDGDGSFASPIVSLAGPYPVFVAVADANADGVPDLAAANQASTVSVLIGNGDGSFGEPIPSRTAPNPACIDAKDLDGDGCQDLAVATWGGDAVCVLTGNCDGTFGSVEEQATGRFPYDVSMDWLDADAHLDVLVGNLNDSTVTVFLGDGTGSFPTVTTSPVGGKPLSLILADFDLDGIRDLALTVSLADELKVFAGNGDGTFSNPDTYATGPGPIQVRSGDLNRDGFADLVVANYNLYTISVFLNDTSGHFGAPSHYIRYWYPSALAVDDLNGDGNPDVAVCNASVDKVSVAMGLGDGTLGAWVDYAVGSFPNVIQVADVQGDGILDVLAMNAGVAGTPGHTISVLYGAGDGTFPFRQDLEVGAFAGDFQVRDMDGDNLADLVYLEQATSVAVLFQGPPGTFVKSPLYGSGNGRLALGDLDEDGDVDVCATNKWANYLTILSNQGDLPDPSPQGATVLVHGYTMFGSFVDPIGQYWVDDDGDGFKHNLITELLGRFGGGEVRLYDAMSGRFQKVSPAAYPEFYSDGLSRPWNQGGHAVLVFDWTQSSNNDRSGHAEAAGEALFCALAATELSSGSPVVDLADSKHCVPLHFIGHSRGAVVASEAVQRLAVYHVPVAGFTTLDPHDFDELDVPTDGRFHDPSVQVWENVLFAANYYQRSSLTAVGVPSGRQLGHLAPGSYRFNRDLTPLSGFHDDAGGAFDNAHGHVITWYDGTLSPGTQMASWYQDGMGNDSGFAQWLAHGGFGIAARSDSILLAIAPTKPFDNLIKYAEVAWDTGDQDRSSPLLFNGDFELVDLGSGGDGGEQIAGWTYHGGGGDGHLQTVDGNTFLQLDVFDVSRRHDRIYVPPHARAMLFDWEVTDPHPTARLKVSLSGDWGEGPPTLFPLSTSTGGLVPGAMPIPASAAGKVATLQFEVIDAILDFQVNLDNVRFDDDVLVWIPDSPPGLRSRLRASPNPFDSRVTLHLSLDSTGPTRVSVLDVQGRVVRELFRGSLSRGQHVVSWGGKTELGTAAVPGIYFLLLESGGIRASTKVVKTH